MFQCEDTGGAADHEGDSGLPLNASFNFLGLLFKNTFTLKIDSNCITEVRYYFSECPAKAHFSHLFLARAPAILCKDVLYHHHELEYIE